MHALSVYPIKKILGVHCMFLVCPGTLRVFAQFLALRRVVAGIIEHKTYTVAIMFLHPRLQ